MRLLSFIEYKLHVQVDLFDKWIKFLFQPTKLNHFFNSEQKSRNNYDNNDNGIGDDEANTQNENKKIKLF